MRLPWRAQGFQSTLDSTGLAQGSTGLARCIQSGGMATHLQSLQQLMCRVCADPAQRHCCGSASMLPGHIPNSELEVERSSYGIGCPPASYLLAFQPGCQTQNDDASCDCSKFLTLLSMLNYLQPARKVLVLQARLRPEAEVEGVQHQQVLRRCCVIAPKVRVCSKTMYRVGGGHDARRFSTRSSLPFETYAVGGAEVDILQHEQVLRRCCVDPSKIGFCSTSTDKVEKV